MYLCNKRTHILMLSRVLIACVLINCYLRVNLNIYFLDVSVLLVYWGKSTNASNSEDQAMVVTAAITASLR